MLSPSFTTVHHSPTAEVRHQRRTEPTLRVGWCFRVALVLTVISGMLLPDTVALFSCSRWKLWALEGHLCNEQGSATCGKWQNWPVRSPFNIISDHLGIFSGTDDISNKTAGPSQSSDLRIGFQGKILMILQEGHLGSKTN